MSVCVITAWHNHTELAPHYFAAVQHTDELIIIDNGSQPPLDFADIRLETNTGYCFANNLGLDKALADIVVFLNNDIKGGKPDWLDRIAAEVKPNTLVGAQIRYDTHADVAGHALPYLDGWCIAGLRTELLELGGFDENLEEPGYYSDNLLCLEARAKGFELIEVPTGLVHLENVTARDRSDVKAASQANRARYQERARELLQVAA